MHLVMNVLEVPHERVAQIEQAFSHSSERMAAVPGFVRFHLLRECPEGEAAPRYVAMTFWQDEASFKAWTESEHFRQAHSGSRGGKSELHRYDVVI